MLATPYGTIISFILIATGAVLQPLLSAVLVGLWLFAARLPARTIGLYKPDNWLKTIVLGIAIGVALKIVMKALVMPLLNVGPAPTVANSYFADVPGNVWAALDGILYVVIAAGFCEEVFWRGYLFHRLKTWFGDARVVNVAIVVGTSVLFALLHGYQGVYGGVHALIVSVVIGGIYLLNQRNLWLPIIVHASFDVVYILLIYAELGVAVDTLIFD